MCYKREIYCSVDKRVGGMREGGGCVEGCKGVYKNNSGG
jgi:hypothetical protein